jgi:polar amino acid transport system substrate-binding protein
MSRRILLTVASLFALAAVPLFHASAQSQPLKLVSTEWPPFTNPAGQPRFALDLVEAALKRIDIATTTAIVAPAQFTPALLSNSFDGSGAVWHDAERENALLFSQAYLENRLVLVGRKGADVSARTFAALKGKRVAIVEGYAYGDIENTGPTFVGAAGSEASLTDLLQGKVDYTLMDALVVEYLESAYPKESQGRLEIGKNVLLTRPLFFALRRSYPNAASIISRFNAQLRTMITDRTYHRLLHVDWILADIDGDGIKEYVPASDKAGPTPPSHAYELFTPESAPASPQKIIQVSPRFYLGGTVYSDWATVPDPFKTYDTNRPDPARSTASIFKFKW